jgi:hypothetical protein
MRYETEKNLWTWGICAIALLIILPILAMFFTSSGEQARKHFASGFWGLERIVTLYDCNGKVIKSWEGNLNVEDQGGTIRFVIDGKTVIVGGNVVVEEK